MSPHSPALDAFPPKMWSGTPHRNAWPFFVAFRWEYDDTRGFYEVRDTKRFWTWRGAARRAAELNAAE